ncbi:hypothetical protein FO440_19820 [Mucilaginibacter corticis]|uniref:Esterase-like activity of phytase family protein n=1 Tax=Mucilaginibacter corticis TaxID=2597670 RepID=A0A556MFN6_9SPHI|nr:hypothetical protein [Mucilaginibacter corticis]TSJ38754.1 hypothetical protein FO440_19820 [Mucilaginibacter corticis]
MSRTKKLNILIPVIFALFLGAYARHRYMVRQITITGHLQDKEMNEISGISASGIEKDIYYVHNDSGDTSRFFSISPDGKLISTIYFKGATKAEKGVVDCEDIAVGPGPDSKKSYVYMGDIGDNYSMRKFITIYRMAEQPSFFKEGVTHATATPLHLKYPDGPKDAETLMVDPLEKLFYVVSKRHDTVGIYTAPLAYKANDTVVMTRRAKLFFAGFKPFKWITAGDISKDGRQILLKSYEKVYYWKRNEDEPVWKVMQEKPEELNYQQERQGEAIGFTAEGKGYYTTSEGIFAPIYYYNTP